MIAKLRYVLLTICACSLTLTGIRAASLDEIDGVHNFHQVDAHVYRGAQPHGAGFDTLAKLGIKTVIDLRGERSEQAEVERTGMHYVRLAWSGYKAPDDAQVAKVLSLMNDSSAWPVFVHCRRGADRTGTAIALYRITHDHWSNQQALQEAKGFGMSSMEVAMQHLIMSFSAPQLASAPQVLKAASDAGPSTAASSVAQPVLQPAP